jgi:hypothetical protein
MELLNLWLPLIGGGVFAAIAIGGWFSEHKLIGIWFGFFAIVSFLLLATLQFQEHEMAEPEKPVQSAADQALLAMQRAMVIVKRPEFVITRNLATGRPEVVRFWVVWENIGQSVALDFRQSDALMSFNQILPSHVVFDPLTPGKEPTIIAPHAEANSGYLDMPVRDFEQFINGTRHLYVVGIADYVDRFEDEPRRHIEWAYRILLEGNILKGIGGIHWVTHGTHNRYYDEPRKK